jgi:ABC-type branched-subunit amino acid transport system substrate-binding protein
MRGSKAKTAARATTALLLAGAGLWGGSAGAVATAASGKTLTVMTMSASPSPGLDTTLGLQAYVKQVDASGGLDGYQLKYSFCSLGTTLETESPNEASTCAHEAVSDHVFAVLGTFDDFDSVALPILQQGGVPLVGEFPYGTIDFTSPWSTPLVATSKVLFGGVAQELVKVGGCKSLALLDSQGDPNETDDVTAVGAVAKSLGVKVVSPQLVPSTQTDLGPSVATLQSEGADCIIDAINDPDYVQPLITAVQQTPSIKHIGVVAAAVPSTVIKSIGSSANGILAIQSANALALSSNTDPGKTNTVEKQMLSDLTKYEPSAIPMNALNYPSWESGYVFSQVLGQMVAKHTPVTSANFEKQLNAMTLVPGIFQPSINFSKVGPVSGEPRVHATDLNYLIVKNGQYVPVNTGVYNVGPALSKYPNG